MEPQVCGSSQGLKGGSCCAPHMHRYSLGDSSAVYSTRHLGQSQPFGLTSAGRAAGPCDLSKHTIWMLLLIAYESISTLIVDHKPSIRQGAEYPQWPPKAK